MRHARNLAFFFLGVLLSVALVVPAYAGAVKVQPKSWYGSNTGGVTKGFNGSTPPGTWSSNDGIWSPPTYKSNGSFKKDGLDIPFSANQDFYPPDLYPGLKQAAKGGFKGLVKGSLHPGPILGGLALNWLIEQGYNWMDELKCQAQVSCWGKDKFSDAPYSAVYDVSVSAISKWYMGGNYTLSPWQHMGTFSNTSACNISDSSSIRVGCVSSQLAQLDSWCKQLGYVGRVSNGTDCLMTLGYGQSVFRAYRVGSATASQPRPLAAVPDTEIEPKLEQAASTNFGPWFQAAVNDGMIIEIPDDRPVVPGVPQPVTAPAKVTTSTETRPDGSTVLKTQTAAYTYTARCIVGADAACTALDPWQITEGKTVTEQTTTCTQAGTCETAVKTEEEASPQPEKTPRQELCEANPKALECLDVGEMPEDQDLPKSEVKMQFGWQPFSLPSTCPQPQSVELMGQTYFYDWSMTCDFAEKIKPFMLITAFITAYFIIMGARRNESN